MINPLTTAMPTSVKALNSQVSQAQPQRVLSYFKGQESADALQLKKAPETLVEFQTLATEVQELVKGDEPFSEGSALKAPFLLLAEGFVTVLGTGFLLNPFKLSDRSNALGVWDKTLEAMSAEVNLENKYHHSLLLKEAEKVFKKNKTSFQSVMLNSIQEYLDKKSEITNLFRFEKEAPVSLAEVQNLVTEIRGKIKSAGPFLQGINTEEERIILRGELFRLAHGVNTVLRAGNGFKSEVSAERKAAKEEWTQTLETVQNEMNWTGVEGVRLLAGLTIALEESKIAFHSIMQDVVDEAVEKERSNMRMFSGKMPGGGWLDII